LKLLLKLESSKEERQFIGEEKERQRGIFNRENVEE
jgi:hypothetical protein